MVFSFLLDISLKTTFWVASNTYYLGKYMIYGSQKTKEEIEREELSRKEDMILERLEKVEKLERVILNNFSPENLVDNWNPSNPSKSKYVPFHVDRRKSV